MISRPPLRRAAAPKRAVVVAAAGRRRSSRAAAARRRVATYGLGCCWKRVALRRRLDVVLQRRSRSREPPGTPPTGAPATYVGLDLAAPRSAGRSSGRRRWAPTPSVPDATRTSRRLLVKKSRSECGLPVGIVRDELPLGVLAAGVDRRRQRRRLGERRHRVVERRRMRGVGHARRPSTPAAASPSTILRRIVPTPQITDLPGRGLPESDGRRRRSAPPPAQQERLGREPTPARRRRGRRPRAARRPCRCAPT